MKQLFIAVMLIFSSAINAEVLNCEQKQSVCEAKCKTSSLISEQDSSTCKAKCLGERTACELEQGKESAGKLATQAKGAGQSLMDKLKAFWDGLTNRQ